jgi:hypothetical protein
MAWERFVNLDLGATMKAVMLHEQPGEFTGSFRVVAARRKIVGAGGGNEQCGRRCRRADAAEPPPQRASQIEHTEVQSRRSFDEDRIFVRCGHPVLTWLKAGLKTRLDEPAW